MATHELRNEPHITNAFVYMDKKQVEYVKLELEQSFFEHHRFKMKLDHDAIKGVTITGHQGQIDLVGRNLLIELQQGDDNANAYQFRGIVTKAYIRHRKGKHGYLVLEGCSHTVLLERGKRLEVFSDMTLKRIFGEVTDGVTHSRLYCVNRPQYDTPVDFILQYMESDWEFLRRLACLSGELLYYTGNELVFGPHKDFPTIEATYDKEITGISFCSDLHPNHFVRYRYLAETDETIERNAPVHIDGATNSLSLAHERGVKLTEKRPVRTPVAFPVEDIGGLDSMVEREKTTTAGRTIYVRGKAKTCHPRIGRLLKIYYPDGDGVYTLGTYRVVSVRHTATQTRNYRCEFEAIPAGLKYIPSPEIPTPVVSSLPAIVTGNEDPKGLGRVQVDFSFANRYSMAWMRIMGPDAGSGDVVEKNRGMVFVPDKGDHVMVGFEFGDPSRPYIMGSMFHGKNGQGGGTDNAIKSIITRSGHTIEFNDADQSSGITIKDRNGNIMHFDTRGRNIEITAPETITLTGKNINIDASEKVEITGARITESASEALSQNTKVMVSEVDEEYKLFSKNIKEYGDTVEIHSQKENMTLYSKKDIETLSGSKKIRLS